MRGISAFLSLLFLLFTGTACSVYPGTPLLGRPGLWLINEPVEGVLYDLASCGPGNEELEFSHWEGAEKKYLVLKYDPATCAPLAGARITLKANPWSDDPVVYHTFSDKNGHFSFKKHVSFRLYSYSETARNTASPGLSVEAPGYAALFFSLPDYRDTESNAAVSKDGLKGLLGTVRILREKME